MPEAPGINLLGRVQGEVVFPGQNEELSLNGTDSIATMLPEIGYPYAVEFEINPDKEQNINGIPGIRSLSSVSQQGQCRITVEFELSVDLETAANDVRDKVSRAQRYLPRDCDPPTVSKADADASPILMVAIQSNTRSLLELSEIADLTVKEQLQTISDVSSVPFGRKTAIQCVCGWTRPKWPATELLL